MGAREVLLYGLDAQRDGCACLAEATEEDDGAGLLVGGISAGSRNDKKSCIEPAPEEGAAAGAEVVAGSTAAS